MYLYIIYAKEPETEVSPIDQITNIGEEAIFVCKSKSEVNWTHNGDKLLPNTIKSKTPEGDNKITIINVQPSNEGTYECQGSKLNKVSSRDEGILTVKGIHKYGGYLCFSHHILSVQVMRDM